jgi:iron complex outermembrane receptor protein
MQKKITFLFFLLMFAISGYSQHTITGKVSAQNLIPIAGSHIHIGKKTVSSDEEGNYSIKNLPNGSLNVHVSYVGYQSIDTIITLTASIVLNFKLKESTNRLNEVVVKQQKNTINKSISEQKLKLETIEKYSNQSLGDALKEIAGVSSLKTGNAIVKPIINGLYGSRVPIINNNVRLEDQQWGTEHAPNLDINSAGKITVIKGASGLQYGGDAVGGLVIIEPISVKKDTLFGKTISNFDSNGRGGSVSSSIHKGNVVGWSYNALGTFKYIGDKTAPDYVLSNTGNRELNFSGDIKFARKNYDFTAFYSYFNAKIGILSASHIGSALDLSQAINNQVPDVVNDFTYSINSPRQEVQHHIAKANFNYYWSEMESLSVQYAFQFNKRLEFDIRRGKYSNTAALDLDLQTHSLLIDYKKTSHDWTFKSGSNVVYQTNFADPDTNIRPLIPHYTKVDVGAYGIVSHHFFNKLIVEAGLRYDFSNIHATKFYYKSRWNERGYDPEFSNFIVSDYDGTQWLTEPNFTFHNISASLGLHKEFDNQLDWYVNMSLATRNPNPSEFFSDGLHHSIGRIELGDLALKKEQSLKISTTVQKKWSAFSIEVNPYLSTIENYMFLKPVGIDITNRGTFPVEEYQQTNAIISGIDFKTHWNISNRWQDFFSISYVNGRDASNKIPLIDIPPLSINHKIQFSKKEWFELLMELKNEVVFFQSRFPNNNFTAIVIINNDLVPRDIDISTPPPGYQLLHFYSEVKFKTFSKTKTTLAFSVQNILNTSYRDYLNRQRLYADEVGRSFQIQLKINY